MAYVIRQKIKFLGIFLTLLLISGCASNYKSYQVDLPHNLEILSNTESIRATLEIYNIGEKCEASYQGVVELDKSIINLGIPTDQHSHLVVSFSQQSFLSPSSHYTYNDFALVPRRGYLYSIDVFYIDDIYNVAIYEINRNTGKKSEMNIKEMRICPPSMRLLRY